MIRPLSNNEKLLIECLLLENKPGYKEFKYKIFEKFVIYEDNNRIVVGKGNNSLEDSSASPLFVSGIIKTNYGIVEIEIYEEFENRIEIIFDPVSFNNETDLNIIETKSISTWSRGDKDPFTNTNVNEFLIDSKNTLVLSMGSKLLWMNNIDTGINTSIPTGGFYNSLMIVKNIRRKEIVLNPKLIFDEMLTSDNKSIIDTVLHYNKTYKKFNINMNELKNY